MTETVPSAIVSQEQNHCAEVGKSNAEEVRKEKKKKTRSADELEKGTVRKGVREKGMMIGWMRKGMGTNERKERGGINIERKKMTKKRREQKLMI